MEAINTTRVESWAKRFLRGVALSLLAQAIIPGILEGAYHREMQNLVANNALPRLWSKDVSLWPVDQQQAQSVKSNLGWLDLPGQLGPLMARVVARAGEIEGAGFEDVVFVSMGDSNLAAESTLRLPSARLGKRTFLLDSLDPDSIAGLEEKLRLDRTLFIFANKSGKNIGMHSLLLYFLERVKALGVPSPANHFVALTEENSYLGSLAKEYEFVDRFLDPPGVNGRFSSLIHFNFFLATLCRLDPNELLSRAQSMQRVCGPSEPKETNPALSLAALLAAAEIEGLDRLVFLGTEKLELVSRRIGCLVGASTGKRGRGIVPIFGRLSYGTELLKRACIVACLRMAGEENKNDVDKKCQQLRSDGIPVVSIELNGPEELAAELFKWEIATALACSLLKIDPFHDPDAGDGRRSALQILERITNGRPSPPLTVRVHEAALELYAEGQTRQQTSTLNMAEALKTFFSLAPPDGYFALLPFMGIDENRAALLRRLRDLLESAAGMPVTVMAGPKYLQALGQSFKGGPPRGVFLVLTVKTEKDLLIPGAGYSFDQLQTALALGEFESLGRHDRPVIRLHLTRGAEQGLTQLETILKTVLGNKRA